MAVEPFDCDPPEWLVLNDVSMVGPGWIITDLTALKDFHELRGQNLPIPGDGAAPVLAFPKRTTQTRKVMPFMVNGDWAQDGSAHADPDVGLDTNLAYLWDNVWSPDAAAADGTVVAEWHRTDGGIWTAAVQMITPLNLGRPFDPSPDPSLRCLATGSVVFDIISPEWTVGS